MGYLKGHISNGSRVVLHERCPRCAKNNRDHGGDNLGVYSDGHAFCFSCSFYILDYVEPRSIERRGNIGPFSRVKAAEHNRLGISGPARISASKNKGRNVCSPETWLSRWGLDTNDLLRYHIDVSEDEVRFKLFQGDKHVYTNIRTFKEGQPKYISKRIIPDATWDPLRSPATSETAPLIIVEDVISAIKIAKAGFQGFPLAGSNMDASRLKRAVELAKAEQATRIWLDPDKRPESLKIASKLNQYEGFKVRPVFSTMDPKYYTSLQIKEKVK